MSRWQEFAEECPEFAASVRARFEANRHHILGTIRRDGSPRLSGTEVSFADGEVGVGMMPDAHKLADVRRDPRVEVHSAPIEHDLVQGDAKLIGRLVDNGGFGEMPGHAFVLDLSTVSLVRVDGDELEFAVWHPGQGLRTVRRR